MTQETTRCSWAPVWSGRGEFPQGPHIEHHRPIIQSRDENSRTSFRMTGLTGRYAEPTFGTLDSQLTITCVSPMSWECRLIFTKRQLLGTKIAISNMVYLLWIQFSHYVDWFTAVDSTFFGENTRQTRFRYLKFRWFDLGYPK